MPRWLFLVFVTALALSVLGSVLIVLRSPRDKPRAMGAPQAVLAPQAWAAPRAEAAP